ncbi:hypothetical protein P22_1952 [Propionispora sp. 2/2-37]|nr:hypothetical protein P22_1952 [Propionispora sp. 2/2-37]
MRQADTQFDASTKLATTKFVQQALGNFRGLQYITGDTVLTTAAVGLVFEFNISASCKVTLPSPVGRQGATLTFIANQASASNTVTLKSAAGSQIWINEAVVSSLQLQRVNTYQFVSDGENWVLISGAGSAVLGPSATKNCRVG